MEGERKKEGKRGKGERRSEEREAGINQEKIKKRKDRKWEREGKGR